MFDRSSRYANQPVAIWVDERGRAHPYVLIRELPKVRPTKSHEIVHLVAAGERLDQIAWQRLGDPLLFWRLCDANGALHPDELTAVVGRELRVPFGSPGGPL